MGDMFKGSFRHPSREEIASGVSHVAQKYNRQIDRYRLEAILMRLLQLFHVMHQPYVEALRTALAEHHLSGQSLEREIFKDAVHAALKERRIGGRKRHAHPGTKRERRTPWKPPPRKLLVLDMANRQRHERAAELALFQLPDNCVPL